MNMNTNKIIPEASIMDLQVGEALATVTNDSFNFLDQTGRKLFYQQGYKGQNVVVAILDTGVNANHIELQGQVLQGKNFARLDPTTEKETDTSDHNGHGSHVAATIAGKLKCGIAPMAKILPIKVIADDGMIWSSDWITDGLTYALNWRGANGEKVDIVNMSFGGRDWSLARVLVVQNIIQQLNAQGTLVIASGGNTGKEELSYPSAIEEVIAVGAVDIKKQIAYFSTTGNQIDLCQIGVDVLSANYANNSGYVPMSGTSMSSPIVSGIAALMICKDKILNGIYNQTMTGTALELSYYKQLKNTSIDLGVAGTDKIYGAGFCTLNQRATTTLQFWLNSKKLVVNGKEIMMDTPSILSPEGRTMISLRYFSENVGGTVTFISKTDPITVEV